MPAPLWRLGARRIAVGAGAGAGGTVPRCWCPAAGRAQRCAQPDRRHQRRWLSAGAGGSPAPQLSPKLRARLEERLVRYASLVEQSSSTELDDGARRDLARELGALEAGAQALLRLRELEEEAASLESLQGDPEAETELQAMAEEELAGVGAARQALETQLLHSLLPKDEAEEGNVILEIRAGAGGDEASIFAADLHDMYSK